MEYLGTVFPTFGGAENDVISIVIQIIVFLVIAFIMIQLIRLYFKNMELKKDPEKNQAEIEKNLVKIEKIIKRFVKIGGIIFGIIIMGMIILSNFIEL